MHANAARVAESAERLGVTIEVVHFEETTRTAAEAAAAIGVHVGQIVKSLVFGVIHPDGSDEIVLALVPGDLQCATEALALAAGGSSTHRVDADSARAATGFPIGGVPPFGHATELRVFLDPAFLDHDVVWAAAGTPNDVFSIAPTDLARAAKATVVSIGRR